MRVVLVGSRNRNELVDTKLVNEIIDSCKEKYSNLIIVVASCDKGVGRIVKSRCINPHTPGKFEFDMIELQLRHYVQMDLPRTEYTSNWNALNATLIELGDEFHILTEEYPKGAMFDLLKRVKRNNRPYAVYKPSESKGGPKDCLFDMTMKSTTEDEEIIGG